MKFVCFHLMPYRPLDMAARSRHRSAWVVLPNALYDPVKGAEEYEAYLDQLTYAETLGFDAIGVNEHHQTAYGMMPAPNLIASALIQRTKKAKIAILGRALPLVNSPIAIAEEFAMLDNLSRGRIIAGFVRGIGTEYHATGLNPSFSLERFQEAHDLIVSAWTRPGPFEFEGEHFNVRYVNLWPRPYQSPHPPIWIPSMGSSETIRWAAAPERKYPFLVTFSAHELVARYLNLYRDAARQFGYAATGDQLGWAAPIYVADSDERARAEAKAGIESLFNDFLANPWEMLLPPGYTSLASMKNTMRVRKALGSRAQPDDRRPGRERHRDRRLAAHRARDDRAYARGYRFQHSGRAAAVRRTDQRTHPAQHGHVRRRGDAAFQGLTRLHFFVIPAERAAREPESSIHGR